MNTNKKGSDQFASAHFRSSEFDCPCLECKETLIDDELLLRLDMLREYLGFPIKVTSGYRCEHYQLKLKEEGYETAAGVSQHTLGYAADIKTGHHNGIELEIAARRCGFKAVGVGEHWIHVDLRWDRDRRWIYSY